MDSLFHKVKQDKAPEILNLIVEISKGEFTKYEYNKDYGVLECDRVLYGPTSFPFNYGDVPQTWNEPDDDPADAVIYSTYPLLPGSLIKGRVVGLIKMIDNEEEDYKIVCVNDKDPRSNHVQDIKDLAEWDIKDAKTFFEIYKYAQTGPGTVEIPEIVGKEEALAFVNQVLEDYKKKFKN